MNSGKIKMSAVKYFLSNKDKHLQIMLRAVLSFLFYFIFLQKGLPFVPFRH